VKLEENLVGTLSSRITATLRNAIVSGEIAPGAKISEPKLSEQLEVSRGPLREAIRRLEMMHLVSHVPHEGVRVFKPDFSQVLEIYQVREALEGMAAGLAAQHMSTEGIDELHRLLEVHEQFIRSNAGEYMQQEGDFDFHYRFIQGSGNQFLINQLCGELYHLIRMVRNQGSRGSGRSNHALRDHQQLVYAIERRDVQLAEMTVRHHIGRAREHLSKRIQEERQEQQQQEN